MAGFVGRKRSQTDERQVIVSLTKMGLAMREESRCLTATLLERSGMPVAELVRMNAEISSLVDALTRPFAGAE